MIEARRLPAAAWTAGSLLFILLATANSAGYRYGASDQAYYIPAIVRAMDPSAFPRDRVVIDAEARLMTVDEGGAWLARVTGLSLPVLFAAAYVAALAVLYVALLLIGRSLYATSWATVALAAALTLRHRITRTGVNTLEGYLHPRMLAFALGALALALYVRGSMSPTPGRTAARSSMLAVALVAVAGVIHPTTALWFAVLIGVSLIVSDPRSRPLVLASGVVGVAIALWAITAGPLRHGLVRMDADWRQAIAAKDFLFPSEWPAGAWLANLGTAAVWAWAYWFRRRAGRARATDTGLAAGGAALLALFFATLPFVAGGMALAVQFQFSRLFWVIDLLATIYVMAAIDIRAAPRLVMRVAATLLVISAARGAYIMQVEQAERPLFAAGLSPTAWTDAMGWLARTPADTHVLADPGHAWKHGTSVRVAAGRDVFHEELKDAALAIYSREVAMRVLERSRAIGDFGQLTAEKARALAVRFDLDYLVAATPFDLPVSYRNDLFVVYELREP